MKNTVFALLMALATLPLWAQSTATTGNADFEAERARLSQERKAAEDRFQAEQKACYQKFAVEGCLEDSRRRAAHGHRRHQAPGSRHQRHRTQAPRRGRARSARGKEDQPRPQDTPLAARAVDEESGGARAALGRSCDQPCPPGFRCGGAAARVREQAARACRGPGQGRCPACRGAGATRSVRAQAAARRCASRRSRAPQRREDQGQAAFAALPTPP